MIGRLSKQYKMKKILLLILPLFLLSSCVELIDDLTLNNDGSGVLKLSINLSKSKLEINSILALDSLNGHRVPKIGEIKDKIAYYRSELEKKDGIKSVDVFENTDDYIFKFNIAFDNVEKLETAVKQIVSEENSSWVDFNFDWIKWENHTLTRNNLKIPESQLKKLKYEDVQKLKQGTYTSITRFEDPILEYSNKSSILTPNKRNLMIRMSAYNLAENTQLVQNIIKVAKN